VDRMCRFSYVQTSGTPVLLFRPECADSTFPTLNQPISPGTAKHSGLSCGVKDAEPTIRGHIKLDRRQSDRSPALAGLQ